MPIHFEDLDVISQAAGLRSALIVPCYMCPATTMAIRENRPFFQFFSSFLKSLPFEEYLRDLQARLKEAGVKADVFDSRLPHQWFLCMWTGARQKKLRKVSRNYEAVIVLGCDSATETVRDAVRPDCQVIEGMAVTGIMNAKLRFHLPGNVSFGDCKIIPISDHREEECLSGAEKPFRVPHPCDAKTDEYRGVV